MSFWRAFLRRQHDASPLSTPPRTPTPSGSADRGRSEEGEEREAFEIVDETIADLDPPQVEDKERGEDKEGEEELKKVEVAKVGFRLAT